MKPIASEQQAEEVGQRLTGGERGGAFAVYQYRDKATGLTLFGVKINATGRAVALA